MLNKQTHTKTHLSERTPKTQRGSLKHLEVKEILSTKEIGK
jgi:hypothetical protein